MNRASLITMIEGWETLSHVPYGNISSSVRLSRRSTWNIDSSWKLFLRKCSLYRSCENNFASLLRRDNRARLPSGLSIITLAYNICTRVVYIHTHGVKFDCTKRTIRGQCTWRAANATNKPGYCPSYLPCALHQIPRCMSALLPEESRSWNFIVTGERAGKERKTRELRSKRFIRIAGLFEPSSGAIEVFHPPTPHLCPDSRRFRTWSSGHKIHCPF